MRCQVERQTGPPLLDQADGELDRDERTSSWEPIDLLPVLSGDYSGPQPEVCSRTDGQPLLYPGRIHWLHGEPESGKTWLAMAAVAEVIEAGMHAVVFDFEDDAASTIDRLRRIGATDPMMFAGLRYVRPEERLTSAALDRLRSTVLPGAALVVIDATTPAMALDGLDPVGTHDTAQWLKRLPAAGAQAGAVTLILDHVVKDEGTRGRWAIGSQAKLAVVTGAAYSLVVRQPIAPGRVGHSTLTIAKDRPGVIRAASVSKVAGEFIVDATDPDRLGVRIEPPAPAADDGGFRPTVLMERVSRFVEDRPGVSQRAIREGVHGRQDAVLRALDLLVAEGYVTVSDGPKRAKLHRSVGPFREGE